MTIIATSKPIPKELLAIIERIDAIYIEAQECILRADINTALQKLNLIENIVWECQPEIIELRKKWQAFPEEIIKSIKEIFNEG